METIMQQFADLRSQDVKSQAAWLEQLCYHIGGDESPTVWWQFYKVLQQVKYMPEAETKSPNAQRFINEARSRIKVTLLYDAQAISTAQNFIVDKF